MRSLIFILALLCLWLKPVAQPLVKGDQLPVKSVKAWKEGRLINIQLAGRYTLLSFFSTTCSSCMRQLPSLLDYQSKMDSLSIVLITYEPRKKLQDVMARRKSFDAERLPVVTSDSLLHAYFPHQSIPHEVWIDPQGRVSAITGSESVTEVNLQAWIKGEKLAVAEKKDILFFDKIIPFALNREMDSVPVLFSSSLFGGVPGAGSFSGFSFSADKQRKRIYIVNQPLLLLYNYALPYPQNRYIMLDVPDSARFLQKSEEALFCYELTVPAASRQAAIGSYMLQDLQRSLGHTGSIQCRQGPDGLEREYFVIRDAYAP